ncbi:cystathionine gamma-synthase [Elizabethkingia meningoseptica]|uniref:cystathionine gamma-synthase n=1 Tax=Elizabethkingia meningoseptica TaxID=238 RepID=UPI000332C0B9|nr:cystathionine gamma-synthase [Elizabethkingia meningoseptica]AQX06470.1 cystathionine gamma-synthase [Elizabethkingia meningoseptica]AQX48517.1 cystathionine gamma-synthase [Elizabethkingia meningoseptica]EOR29296.1 Cystathionine gamma-lyase [Elizabethkingia meningoseptica ATCC 13253 = NBRC 12535]KUY16604.1 cystathionine gamma-synthase [Elizabethkingia meningoseptica]MCL1676411.1 cystathionine gamma-synthase [Elizabethkingia meningoseptica]
MKFNTKVIHGNQHAEPHTGSVNVPVFLTSTFAQKSPGQLRAGYEYSRGANPTRQALEDSLASIENGARGLAFGSGLAAIDCVLKLLNPGDEVIAVDDLYGGTYRMFTRLFEKYQLKFTFVNFDDVSKISALLTDKTRLIWLETPTNPLMKLVDIKAVADIIKGKDILLAVDNTFASAYLQQPLDLGADIVMHSATKYLGGHSDVVAGALVAKTEELGEKLHFIQFASGGILGPHDSYLVLRGIKTLALRMQRHSENGIKIAQFLEKHPDVEQVFFPGLESHPQFELAKRQMKDFGGMVSFTFKSGKKEDAVKFLENLQVFTLAESLGGVESLANHPAMMTHASIPAEKRAELGITDDLVRLSVGIEDAEDLLQDVEQALAAK